MKKAFIILIAFILSAPVIIIKASALNPVDIYSNAAVLIDANTGQVLYDKNMNRRVYPASTTKIMTGVLALENSYPGEMLTVTESAIAISEPESSNIALVPGEELPLDSAMYALMLPSANDAANVIAEHVAGSQEAFAAMMNAKAAAIGAMHTHFTNPHGLHEDDHYTTAYDMALITKYAAGNDTFMKYFGADLHTIPATNLQPSERPFTNYQYMLLKTSRFYDEDVIGGKVGYTVPAQHTMSTVATRNGRTLICVVMGSSRNNKFTDTKALLDFGFDEFTQMTIPWSEYSGMSVPVLDNGVQVGNVSFSTNNDFTFLIHNSVDPESISFDYDIPEHYEGVPDSKPIATVKLLADSEDEAVPSLLLSRVLLTEMAIIPTHEIITEDPVPLTDTSPKSNPVGLIIFVSVPLILAALITWNAIENRRRRKARLKRLNSRLREHRSPQTSSPVRIYAARTSSNTKIS